jgi:hypothetical protein
MGGSSGPPGGGYVPRKPGSPKGGGGSGGVGGDDDPCSFRITTTLASPNSTVVSGLSPGHILEVYLNTSGQSPVAEVRTGAGEVAGTVAGIPNLRALIGCMGLGIRYQFTISSISGSRVDGVLRNR